MEAESKLYPAIMVSSTYTDLEAHRREVIDAILRLVFRANAMEYSGARSDADVIDSSLQMVRDSAAYLCVIGHKYGQTPLDADRNPKGLSITELEFNEARRLGRPILLFLMADDHLLTKADIEPDSKKQKKLEAFHKQAKRVDPGKETERVYETFKSKDEFAKKAAIAVGLLAIRTVQGPDIPDRAIRDAVARFIDVKPDANQAELTDAIKRFETGYRDLERQLAAIAVTDNRVTSLKAAAEAALAEGDLDKARAAYREAAEAARDKAAEPVRTAAELRSAEAGAHLLALDWEAADAAWTEAATMLAPFDQAGSLELAEDSANRLKVHGRLYARAGALSAAIDRLRALGAAAKIRGDEREVARFRNNLGNALQTLGDRTGGTEGLRLLNEAVTAYRDALMILNCGDDPVLWAMTQMNLGSALHGQGERTAHADGLRLFDEAIAAYRDAHTVFTRNDMPVDWAQTQNNLGNTFSAQGERTDGPESLRLLNDAVRCFREVLDTYEQAARPIDWAATQNNLGIALQALGQRTDGPEGLHFLDEAVGAYREALTVRTCAEMPADWAATWNNLAIALAIQGRRIRKSEGFQLLDEAVTAFRESLTVHTRVDAPAVWAITQENIGLALLSMADVNPDRARAHLLEAEAAIVAALEVYTPEHMSFYHDKATVLLARVRAKLAALDS